MTDRSIRLMTKAQNELLRSIPAVTRLLAHEEVTDWLNGLPRATVVASIQEAVDSMRQAVLAGEWTEPVDEDDVLALAEEILLERTIPSIRRVINATGIVLHTGLGRAPLGDAVIEALAEGASGYCNLEYDLTTGGRGRRTSHVVEQIIDVTGAEAATVVNNNAAATFIILQTLAANREVVVSRGQLVEIGGSFRLPDIMSASSARLHEVGATNRTHLADYEGAINDDTALLMRVHTSNYRIIGFASDVPIEALADLAHRYELPAVDDLGSGALFDLSQFGLPQEPVARDSLEAGADLVCFSGDKLLGGPQCGIIAGRKDLIDQIDANPLARTYRVDKLALIALEATLRQYADPQDAVASVPALAMLAASTDELAARATVLAETLSAALPNEQFLVCSDTSSVGGGSMPGHDLETVIVQWRLAGCQVDDMADRLRNADEPAVVRIRDDAICLDLRTIREADMDPLVAAISSAVWEQSDSDGESE